MKLKVIHLIGCVIKGKSAHIFALHLLLGELNLDEGLHGGEELPPRPVLHATVLIDVLLDAADCQILNLNTRVREQLPKENMVQICVFKGSQCVRFNSP